MTDPVDTFLDEQRPMLKMVDEILDTWNGAGCYQIPKLVQDLALQFNWDSEQARRNDPIIRAYLKTHPVWYITRGAGGGVMRLSEHQRKEAAKVAKEKAKLDLQAAVAAAKAAQPAADTSGQDNTNS
jgi:hypothetical protein